MPQKKKRIIRSTALIYCEGIQDLIFIRLLKTYYASDDPPSRPKISVRKGRGGTAHGLVEDAVRLEGFDRCLVKLDNDRPASELAKAKIIANKHGITLAISKPCLESLMLDILQPGTDYSRLTSPRCKKIFESTYVPKDKRVLPEAYHRHFTKKKIDAARPRNKELDDLICFIEQQ